MVLAKKQTILANVVVMCVAALSGCIRCERKVGITSNNNTTTTKTLARLNVNYIFLNDLFFISQGFFLFQKLVKT